MSAFVKQTSASDGATICGDEGVMQGIYLAVGLCLLPTVALAGQRSEQRSLYQRPDGEWLLCRGQVCDQPEPPAWAPLPDRQQHQRGDRDQITGTGRPQPEIRSKLFRRQCALAALQLHRKCQRNQEDKQ